MIGNDVVDIIQSRKESNWQRRGFLNKLFTTEEQHLITNHLNNEIMVWRLWSMKEAAYKIYNRQTKIRAFIPMQLLCHIEGCYGTVTCNGHIYYTETYIDTDKIYTVATVNKRSLNDVREVEYATIVKDSNDHPFIYNSQKQIFQPVSVTHHGRYSKIAALQL